MSINGRSKGNRGERIAASVIKDWTAHNFARVPSSGGLQWKNSHAKGDIVCSDEGHYFPFCLEVKFYKDINFEHLLYLDKAKVLEYWNQCRRDAEIAQKCPMLLMRYNGLPKNFFFIAIPQKPFTKFFKLYLDNTDKILVYPSSDMVLFTTDSLMKIPYKKIRKLVKSLYKPKK